MADHQTDHHLAPVVELRPAAAGRPVDDTVDVDTIARLLLELRNAGRGIAARSLLVLPPDRELEFAGHRVEHIAEQLFRRIFAIEAPR